MNKCSLEIKSSFNNKKSLFPKAGMIFGGGGDIPVYPRPASCFYSLNKLETRCCISCYKGIPLRKL